MKNLEQAIIVEVRNSFQVVETRKKSLDSARLARVLSEELLAGETARFQVGFSTNFEVLRYQRDVEAARVWELRALVDFQLAIVSLQRATDVLLEENGIVLPAPR